MFELVAQRVRRLARRPQLSLPAVGSLALGGAGVVLLLTLIHGIVLAPLPYQDSNELTWVGWRFSAGQAQPAALNADMARYVSEHATGFADVGRYADAGNTYALDAGDGIAQSVAGMRVDDRLLRTLRVQPAYGRGIRADDITTDARVAVIAHGLATRLYGVPAAAVGGDVTLDGETYTVVGVLPAGFSWQPPVGVLVPLVQRGGPADWGHNTAVIGRLAPGVTVAQAHAEMDALLTAWHDEAGASLPTPAAAAWVEPLKDVVVGDTREPLVQLFAAVVALLLLACFNVANLVLADATATRGDAAVQLALGARSRHLHARRFLDCLLLAVAGLALGTILAVWLLPAVVALAPQGLPRLDEVRIGGLTLLMMAPFAVAAAALCAALAAAGQRAIRIADALRGGAAGRGGVRIPLRKAMTIGQIALSYVLLACAAALAASMFRLANTDPGFAAEGVHVAQVSFVDQRFRTGDAAARTGETLTRIADALRAQPGVEGVAMASSLPLTNGLNNFVQIPGREDGMSVQVRLVTPGYFEVLGIPVHAGRPLTDGDRADTARVVVVNAAFARALLGGNHPVGSGIHMDGHDWRVVGVAGDVRDINLRTTGTPTVYMAYDQVVPELIGIVHRWFPTAVLARGAVAPDFRRVVEQVAPEVPVLVQRPLAAVVGESLLLERFVGVLLAAFGACALLLSVTGLFGLLEFERVRRRHEMAVRVALGARAAQVVAMVVRQGGAWAMAGLALGAVLAVPALRGLENLLFQAGAADVGLLAALGVGVLIVTLAAAAISARRAARVQPSAALRHE